MYTKRKLHGAYKPSAATRANNRAVNHDGSEKACYSSERATHFPPFSVEIRAIESKGRFPVTLKKGKCKLDITSCCSEQSAIGGRYSRHYPVGF